MTRLGLIGRIILLATAMMLATALSAWVVFTFLTRGGEVPVPDLTDLGLEEALQLTSQSELGLRISSTGFDPSVPLGHIISQDPNPGIRTRKNRIVKVVVSRGTPTVYVPNLTGLKMRRVELQLSQAGLEVGHVSRTHHPDVEPGAVITQNPAQGQFVARSEKVDILISEGDWSLTYVLPDFTGFPAEDVLITLRQLGLKTGRLIEVESRELPPGTVTSLQPPAGSAVTQGQTIHLTVTTMPKRRPSSPVILYGYKAPPGLLDRQLKLILLPEEGEESVLFEDIVPAGTSVTVPVAIPEPGVLKVYVDGSLLEEKEVP
jgi:serine/threonine-protein kinase